MKIFVVDMDGKTWDDGQQNHEGHGRPLDPLGDLSVLRDAVMPDLENLRNLGLKPDWQSLRDMTDPRKW